MELTLLLYRAIVKILLRKERMVKRSARELFTRRHYLFGQVAGLACLMVGLRSEAKSCLRKAVTNAFNE